MGQVYITVGTGLIYSRTAATMFGGVSKVSGREPRSVGIGASQSGGGSAGAG